MGTSELEASPETQGSHSSTPSFWGRGNGTSAWLRLGPESQSHLPEGSLLDLGYPQTLHKPPPLLRRLPPAMMQESQTVQTPALWAHPRVLGQPTPQDPPDSRLTAFPCSAHIHQVDPHITSLPDKLPGPRQLPQAALPGRSCQHPPCTSPTPCAHRSSPHIVSRKHIHLPG